MLYEHSAIRPHPPSLSVGTEGTTQNLPADSLQVPRDALSKHPSEGFPRLCWEECEPSGLRNGPGHEWGHYVTSQFASGCTCACDIGTFLWASALQS